MNFVIIVLIFIIHITFLYNVTSQSWIGRQCHPSSNSSSFEEKYSQRNETISLFNDIKVLNKCFYWISGDFNPKLSFNVKQQRRNHFCIKNYLATQNKSDYRDTIRQMFQYTKESILHRSFYDCQEELPTGYYRHTLMKLPAYWYSRQELYSHMKGKLLWFGGNSMTRQLFQRVIMFVRGMKVFIEHFSHRDMIYGFNDKLDYWEICEFGVMHGGCRGSSIFWSNFDDNSSLALLVFTFDQDNIFNETDSNFPINLLVGKVQQQGWDDPEWKILRILDNISLELPMQHWSLRMQAALPNWPSRNRVMHTYNETSTIDDAHFQCGAEQKFPKPIDKIKTPISLDCSDPFNLNIIQRLFMFLFDHRVSLS